MRDWNDKLAAEINLMLAEAALEGDVEQMKAALEHGAQVNTSVVNPPRPSVLFAAAEAGQTAAARLLLERGAVFETRDLQNFTPLLMAVRNGHVETARLLLDHGADPAKKCTEGDALALAQRLEDGGPMLRLLLGRAGRKQLSKAFFDAAKRGEETTVRVCLSQPGFDVNLQDGLGNTALILAAASDAPGSADVVRLLIRRGAEVDAENDLRETALSAALTGGKYQPEALRLLLDAGADIFRTTLAGVSNFEAAQLYGDKELLPHFETARKLRVLRDLKQGNNDPGAPSPRHKITVKPRPPQG